MTIVTVRKDRHMLPRWRSFAKAVASGELSIPMKSTSGRDISPELRSRLEEWRVRQNIIAASEAVESAIVEGHEVEAVRPARTLVNPDSGATPMLRKQAALLLQRAGIDHQGAERDLIDSVEGTAIASARRRTRTFPRDPFAWADLSLAHATSGNDETSKRCMSVALQLAPNDRHILRSAARLYLHVDEADRAYDLIRHNEATPGDPWLMAGEIAISALADRKPAFVKSGSKLIEDGRVQPKHLSELAGAIGTVHLRDGNRKARKLFTTSLIDPNGNSLAQAEWASPHIGNLVDPRAIARVSDSAEAKVFQASWAGKFEEAINACHGWHEEEPFSSRPYQFGSGAACTIEQFNVALKFADDGLRANPNALVLHNNKAFALISLGRCDEALSILLNCCNKFPEESRGSLTATAGLLAMRLGQFAEGIAKYRDAISWFKRMNSSTSEALASAYLAQETARANLPEARHFFEEATKLSKNVRFLPEAEIVLERASLWLKANALRNTPLEVLHSR